MATSHALEELVSQIPTARPRELGIIEERLKVLQLAQQVEANN